jgi:hypothetical protein
MAAVLDLDPMLLPAAAVRPITVFRDQPFPSMARTLGIKRFPAILTISTAAKSNSKSGGRIVFDRRGRHRVKRRNIVCARPHQKFDRRDTLHWNQRDRRDGIGGCGQFYKVGADETSVSDVSAMNLDGSGVVRAVTKIEVS